MSASRRERPRPHAFSFCSSNPEASRQPPSSVAMHRERRRLTGRPAVPSREPSSPVASLPYFGPAPNAGRSLRPGRDDVDDAVHGARAVQHAARAAQHLDGGGLLEVDFEEFVDVAGPDRPDRDRVLEHEHRAAGAGAGQYRRAQRRQRFLRRCRAGSSRPAARLSEFRGMRRAGRARRHPRSMRERCRHSRSSAHRRLRVAVTTTSSSAQRGAAPRANRNAVRANCRGARCGSASAAL